MALNDEQRAWLASAEQRSKLKPGDQGRLQALLDFGVPDGLDRDRIRQLQDGKWKAAG